MTREELLTPVPCDFLPRYHALWRQQMLFFGQTDDLADSQQNLNRMLPADNAHWNPNSPPQPVSSKLAHILFMAAMSIETAERQFKAPASKRHCCDAGVQQCYNRALVHRCIFDVEPVKRCRPECRHKQSLTARPMLWRPPQNSRMKQSGPQDTDPTGPMDAFPPKPYANSAA